MLGLRKFWVACDDLLGGEFGGAIDVDVAQQIPQPKFRGSRLHGTGELPGPAKTKIFVGNFESVGRARENVEPLALARVVWIDEDAKRFGGGAANASSQLMKLREAVTLRIEDYHRRSVWNVDADFDDGRRDEHVEVAADESAP